MVKTVNKHHLINAIQSVLAASSSPISLGCLARTIGLLIKEDAHSVYWRIRALLETPGELERNGLIIIDDLPQYGIRGRLRKYLAQNTMKVIKPPARICERERRKIPRNN